MIQTIKFDNLPDDMQRDLIRSYYDKIDWIPLREMYYKTGISINTLRTLREKREASYKTWKKLIDGLN